MMINEILQWAVLLYIIIVLFKISGYIQRIRDSLKLIFYSMKHPTHKKNDDKN